MSPELSEDWIFEFGDDLLSIGFMSEDEWDRDECRLGHQEQRQDRVSQDIFESWSPTLGEHLLKYRDQSACDDRSELRIGILEHIEPDRKVLIGRIKEDDVVGS